MFNILYKATMFYFSVLDEKKNPKSNEESGKNIEVN